jgi:hypothetical protein
MSFISNARHAGRANLGVIILQTGGLLGACEKQHVSMTMMSSALLDIDLLFAG